MIDRDRALIERLKLTDEDRALIKNAAVSPYLGRTKEQIDRDWRAYCADMRYRRGR